MGASADVDDEAECETAGLWYVFKHYCHEGARELQDVADYTADVRVCILAYPCQKILALLF